MNPIPTHISSSSPSSIRREVHYEDVFPPVFGLLSLLVLALALSKGHALFMGPKIALPGESRGMPAVKEAFQVLLGLLLVLLTSIGSALLSIGTISLLSSQSIKVSTLASLAIAATIGLGLLLTAHYTLFLAYCLIALCMYLTRSLFEARIAFAIATLNVASKAIFSLPEILIYTSAVLGAYIGWFSLWLFAVYGIATPMRKIITTRSGSRFPVEACTSYTYTKVDTVVKRLLQMG